MCFILMLEVLLIIDYVYFMRVYLTNQILQVASEDEFIRDALDLPMNPDNLYDKSNNNLEFKNRDNPVQKINWVHPKQNFQKRRNPGSRNDLKEDDEPEEEIDMFSITWQHKRLKSRFTLFQLIFVVLALSATYPIYLIFEPHEALCKKMPVYCVLIPLIVDVAFSILSIVARFLTTLCISLVDPDPAPLPSRLKNLGITQVLNLKNIAILTSLKLSPFIQIFLSFLSGHLTDKHGVPGLVVLCSFYPALMGAIQKVTSFANEKFGMGFGILIETYSLLFASLPYKLKWLGMSKNAMAFLVLGIKGGFKVVAYIAIPVLRQLVDNMAKKADERKERNKRRRYPGGNNSNGDLHIGVVQILEGTESQFYKVDLIDSSRKRRDRERERRYDSPRRQHHNQHYRDNRERMGSYAEDIDDAPNEFNPSVMSPTKPKKSQFSGPRKPLPGPPPHANKASSYGSTNGSSGKSGLDYNSKHKISYKKKNILRGGDISRAYSPRSWKHAMQRRLRMRKKRRHFDDDYYDDEEYFTDSFIFIKLRNFLVYFYKDKKRFTLKFMIHELADNIMTLSVFTLTLANNYIVKHLVSKPRTTFPSDYVRKLTIWTGIEFGMDTFFLVGCLFIFKEYYFKGKGGVSLGQMYSEFMKGNWLMMAFAVLLLFFMCFYITFYVMIKASEERR